MTLSEACRPSQNELSFHLLLRGMFSRRRASVYGSLRVYTGWAAVGDARVVRSEPCVVQLCTVPCWPVQVVFWGQRRGYLSSSDGLGVAGTAR